MTTTRIGDTLDELAIRLGSHGLPARQEARDLIAAVLDVPRFWPSAHRNEEISAAQATELDEAVDRLTQGMPFAYAARRASFRKLTLYVDERVLIPRPETELLVEIILDATKGGQGTAIDVGTGSGCIALSLAEEGKFDRVIGTDISRDALAVANRNRESLFGGSSLTRDPRPETLFLEGEYLAPCATTKATVIASNPPYISRSEREELPALVREWEPAIALFADDDGMACIREIVNQSVPVLVSGGLLALEVDSRRAGRAAEIVEASSAYRDVTVKPDLTGRARFVFARRVEE